MTSPTNPKSDQHLATAIRSAFDDIVFATKSHDDAHPHDDRGPESAEVPVRDDVAALDEGSRNPAILTGAGQRGLDRSRWLLSAAAALILVIGIGALTTVDIRDTDQADPVGAPAETIPATVEQAPNYRFADPLPESMVPFLEPAPAVPETVDRLRSSDWVSGITGFSLFGVRQVDGPASAVVVRETAVPWDLISAGLPTETIGGIDAVVVRSPGETGLFIKEGSTTRAVFDAGIMSGDGEAPADVSSEARTVGELLAGQPLDAVTVSDRVVQITSYGAGSRAVRYGSGTQAETVLFHTTIPASMHVDDVPLAAEIISRTSLPTTPNGLAFERVSPTDLIVVAAPNQELADEALAAIQFGERPNTTSSDEEQSYDQVVARGEPSWGRWELATQSADPTCWHAAATIWGPGNAGDEAGQCRDAGATGAAPTAFCVYMDDRIIGASLDRDAIFDFQSKSGPSAFEATVEQTGDTISFQVRDANEQADIPQVEITVDGTPLACSI